MTRLTLVTSILSSVNYTPIRTGITQAATKPITLEMANTSIEAWRLNNRFQWGLIDAVIDGPIDFINFCFRRSKTEGH